MRCWRIKGECLLPTAFCLLLSAFCLLLLTALAYLLDLDRAVADGKVQRRTATAGTSPHRTRSNAVRLTRFHIRRANRDRAEAQHGGIEIGAETRHQLNRQFA